MSFNLYSTKIETLHIQKISEKTNINLGYSDQIDIKEIIFPDGKIFVKKETNLNLKAGEPENLSINKYCNIESFQKKIKELGLYEEQMISQNLEINKIKNQKSPKKDQGV